MVFQAFNLFPHLSALANVPLALVRARLLPPRGLIVEHGEPERIFTAPERPETQRFLRRLLEAGRL